jgi:hypothetical protein
MNDFTWFLGMLMKTTGSCVSLGFFGSHSLIDSF